MWVVRFVRFCFGLRVGVFVVVFVVWLAGLFFFRGDLCTFARFGVGFRGWLVWWGLGSSVSSLSLIFRYVSFNFQKYSFSVDRVESRRGYFRENVERGNH